MKRRLEFGEVVTKPEQERAGHTIIRAGGGGGGGGRAKGKGA